MSGDKVWVYDAVNRTGTADAISGETMLGSYAQNQPANYDLWDSFLDLFQDLLVKLQLS